MRVRVLVGFGVLSSALAVAVLAACASPTPPDVPNYGPPNGIDGKHPSAPDGEDAGVEPTPTEDSGGGSSGGGIYANVKCATPLGDAGCAVSWKNDLYAKMKSGGTWGCGTVGTCHGSVGGTAPFIDPASESATYISLQAAVASITTPAGNPYINPCSTDPNASDFVCNTLATGFCGAGAMPLASTALGTGPIAAAGLADIAAWVACGAPEN